MVQNTVPRKEPWVAAVRTQLAPQPMWKIPPRMDAPPPLTLYTAVYSVLSAVLLAQVLALFAMARGAADATCGAHECVWQPPRVAEDKGEWD